MRLLLALAAATCLHVSNAHALAFSIFNGLADWQTAVGSSTLQDFSSFAPGTSVQGAEVLPGVVLTTNLGDVNVIGASNTAFATGSGTGSRAAGNALYELNLGNAYRAAALDLGAFESAEPPFNIGGGAIGPGIMEILFGDGFLLEYQLFGNDASSNVFFGITSDTAITRLRWFEAHEQGNINEETSLDNLRVALAVTPVPEPSTVFLAGGGLLLFARSRRR